MTHFLQNAGRYRQPITFQKQVTTINEYGERIQTFSNFLNTRAEIAPLSGQLLISAQAIKAEITHKVTCRYAPNLTHDMRILFGTRMFYIIAIINFQERNKELQIMCKEYYV
jgi:SPP1 family predicted phage head-tail adaptor